MNKSAKWSTKSRGRNKVQGGGAVDKEKDATKSSQQNMLKTEIKAY